MTILRLSVRYRPAILRTGELISVIRPARPIKEGRKIDSAKKLATGGCPSITPTPIAVIADADVLYPSKMDVISLIVSLWTEVCLSSLSSISHKIL